MNGEDVPDLVVQYLDLIGSLLIEYGLDALGAVVMLVVGWTVAGWVERATRRGLDRLPRIDATVKPMLASVVRYGVLTVTVIAVLGQFGVQTASILTVLGAAGLAIGLALQGTLSNIAAGFMLLLLRPFRVDDYIDADGIAGTVTAVGLFTVEMRTFDGIYLSVPNSQVWNRSIRNFSRLPTRRVDVTVGISYGDDVDGAMKVLDTLLRDDPRVLADPAPEVMVVALADSSVNINLRCWVASADYWAVLFDLNRRAKSTLERNGFSIPFPQRDVHLIQPKT
jgi:small conductance mechanosensitive channel